ncbi:uncharacterized protein [Amphiura filiformis]|uniref:uncharacterized protein n=1 Tax=Amphiura filiformis TaxID=82378 RepID=UPI003B2176E3
MHSHQSDRYSGKTQQLQTKFDNSVLQRDRLCSRNFLVRPKTANDDCREAHASWSLTQLPEDPTVTCEDTELDDQEEIEDEWDESNNSSSIQEAWPPALPSSQDMASVPDERPRVDSIARIMEGPPAADDDYDTDIEEDFPPGPMVEFDQYGRNVYIHECREEGVDPARYVLRHMHESSLQLRHRYLNLRNIIPLAKALKINTCIEYLDLSDNHLEHDGAIAIADMMSDNCYVTKLNLSENLVRSDATFAFTKMLETNYTLKCLCLRANQLTDRDALVLSEALKNNSTLTELDLSQNKLGEQAGIHLGSALGSNDGLIYLDLKWNAIRGKGIVAIANALKANSSLEVLDLSWNGVTQPECIAFMKMLKVNTGLKILDLSHNHVNTIGLQKMSLGIKKNDTIEALLLNTNPIGDDGVLSLLKNLLHCPTLKLVALQDIALSIAVHGRIREIQANRDICILTRDIDGHKRIFPPSHLVSIVDQFILTNQMRLIERCFALDESRRGTISATQLQKALFAAGLDLSQDQVKTALKDVNILHSMAIPYRLLLDGLSALTN